MKRTENLNSRMSLFLYKLGKARPKRGSNIQTIEAPFSKDAYTSHGPIIHPRLVGQHTTSPLRTSMWHHASAAAFRGVILVHGIAFGSPIPPNEVHYISFWLASYGE